MIKRILNIYNRFKKNGIQYIQIGAFDGITGDIIFPFLKKYRWRGVRVEPMPFYFNKLVELHKDDLNTVCVNKAISAQNSIAKLFSVSQASDNPSFAEQLSSFSKEVILKHSDKIPNLESKIIESEVYCISYSDLVREYATGRIDLVYIDTEGYDYEIVKQIDFGDDRPEIIIFENKHLEQQVLEKLLFQMHSNNYVIIKDGQDTMLIDSGIFQSLIQLSNYDEIVTKVVNRLKKVGRKMLKVFVL